MSVTFQITFATGQPLLRCACDEIVDEPDSPFPTDFICPACKATVNVNNRNATDLIQWLDLNPRDAAPMVGIIKATELAARCRRRLWPEDRNQDPALEPVTKGNLFTAGRDPGYLRMRTRELLVIASMAGTAYVSWS